MSFNPYFSLTVWCFGVSAGYTFLNVTFLARISRIWFLRSFPCSLYFDCNRDLNFFMPEFCAKTSFFRFRRAWSYRDFLKLKLYYFNAEFLSSSLLLNRTVFLLSVVFLGFFTSKMPDLLAIIGLFIYGPRMLFLPPTRRFFYIRACSVPSLDLKSTPWVILNKLTREFLTLGSSSWSMSKLCCWSFLNWSLILFWVVYSFLPTSVLI